MPEFMCFSGCTVVKNKPKKAKIFFFALENKSFYSLDSVISVVFTCEINNSQISKGENITFAGWLAATVWNISELVLLIFWIVSLRDKSNITHFKLL